MRRRHRGSGVLINHPRSTFRFHTARRRPIILEALRRRSCYMGLSVGVPHVGLPDFREVGKVVLWCPTFPSGSPVNVGMVRSGINPTLWNSRIFIRKESCRRWFSHVLQTHLRETAKAQSTFCTKRLLKRVYRFYSSTEHWCRSILHVLTWARMLHIS